MMVRFAELNCDPDPEARLMTDLVLRQFFAEPAIMQLQTPPIEVVLATLFREGIEAGQFAEYTDCDAAARLVHAAFYSVKAAWLRPGPYVVPFDLVDRVRDDLAVILRGLNQ
jgi:hypothetical protein